MYCKNCGHELKENTQFCPNCGEATINNVNSNERLETEFVEEDVEKPKKRIPWIIGTIACICILAAIAGIFFTAKAKEEKYEKKIEEARELTEQEKYEDAIKIYRDAITIKADKDTAYLELAEIYVTQEQPEEAQAILEEAKNNTNSKKATQRYEEIKQLVKQNADSSNTTSEGNDKKKTKAVTKGDESESLYEDYIEHTLIPEYGVAKGGPASVAYNMAAPGDVANGLASVPKPEDMLGIHSIMEKDMDGDDIPELIVVRIAEEESDAALYTGFLYVQVFSMDGDEVIELEQPKRIMRYGTLQLSESGNLNVFVVEQNDENYLCVMNCMRSPLIQFSYNMYMDVMQIENSNIICKKSVTMDYSQIYDTTNLSIEENTVQELSQRKILYESEEADLWYDNLIEPFKQEFDEYFDLGDGFIERFEADISMQIASDYRELLPLPYEMGFSEIMLNAVDIFRIRAIYNPNEGMQYWECLDYTDEIKDDEDSREQQINEKYQEIIDEYRMTIEGGSANITFDFIAKYSNVNKIGVMLGNYSDANIFYGLIDIDSNGIDELVLGLKGGAGNIRVMDLYAYDGVMARKLLWEDTMAERSPVTIYTDGTIYMYASGGAQYGGAFFYKLSCNGYAAVLTERYISDWDMYPDTPYYNENESLSEEEFNNKLNALGGEIEIPWESIQVDIGKQ